MKKRTRRIAFFLPVLVSHWWIDPLNFIQNDAEANPANQSESSANCRIIDETMFSFKLFETSTGLNLDFVAIQVWINGRAPQWFKWWKLTRRRYIHGISHSWDAK